MKVKEIDFFYLGLIIMLIPYVIWFILGENSYVLIHDNLDSEFVYIKLLIESNNLLGFDPNEKIPYVMNGLNRSFFRSGFNLVFLIFKIFPGLIAYIVHHMIVHLVGFVGMFLFLQKYVIKNKVILTLLISLCFGYLSYYHIQYGISISGQPILLFSFLNILHKEYKYYNWLIILIFPFCSFLPVTLPFYLPFLVLIGSWFVYKYKEPFMIYWISLFLLCVINGLVEFNLIHSTFMGGFISHRTEWNVLNQFDFVDLNGFSKSFIKKLEYTHYHAGKFFTLPILVSVILALLLRVKLNKKVLLLLILIAVIVGWVVFSGLFVSVVGKHFRIFNTFNTQRFYFLLPFIWLTLLAFTLNSFRSKGYKIIALIFSLIILISVIENNEELIENMKIMNGQTIKKPTYKHFYDRELFDEIKNELGSNRIENSYFLCVGIPPNIAQFNSLKTLGSYQYNYPLSYKHEFRKIIKKELDKNDIIKKYFDDWGSRCYAFSSELGSNFMFGKSSEKEINKLDFNYEQVKLMNTKYLLSAVPINDSLNLSLLNSFESKNSFWRLYLYDIL